MRVGLLGLWGFIVTAPDVKAINIYVNGSNIWYQERGIRFYAPAGCKNGAPFMEKSHWPQGSGPESEVESEVVV
jgi:hypothetical protein